MNGPRAHYGSWSSFDGIAPVFLNFRYNTELSG
jgi:hypothetical protein